MRIGGRFLRMALVSGIPTVLMAGPVSHAGAVQIEPGPTFEILCEDSFLDVWPEIVKAGETTTRR
jgi:hypothetical protein